MLEIEVYEIRGKCPVYKVGDKIVVDDPKIVLEKTDALCTHALSSLLHYTLVLDRGADSVELGLSKPEDRFKWFLASMLFAKRISAETAKKTYRQFEREGLTIHFYADIADIHVAKAYAGSCQCSKKSPWITVDLKCNCERTSLNSHYGLV